MYASLLISLLAAFVAMLGKQWINRYLRGSGGSVIERCEDRQRKCDGLEKSPLHFLVECLPVMLQVALLLLVCGLCQHMRSINASVAYILIGLIGLGVAFYVATLIAGTSSYASPFQTPASIIFRGQWKKIRRRIISFIVHYKWVLSWTHRMRDVRVRKSESWLEQKDLAIILRTNTSDASCVSWIIRNITDPEALDAAIRLAGMVRWFDDGINGEPPYDLIVSTFEECFDSTWKLNPGSRDRAYNCGRAIVWIHTLATCKSKEFANRFPLPDTECPVRGLGHDLTHLLLVIYTNLYPMWTFKIDPEHSPSHLQWTSDVLLHLTWANRTALDHEDTLNRISRTHENTTKAPLNATLNRLLVWCIYLGSSVEEETLKVQDKSYDISSFCSPSCSQRSSPVITWNESYTNCPQRSFQLSVGPALNVESSRTCYMT